MKRTFKVEFTTEVDTETLADGLQKTKEDFKMFNPDVKPVISARSDAQNRSLHKWFELIEEEAQTNGETMDMLVKKPNELPITRHLLKDMFRLLGNTMFGRKSTADLKKDELSEVVMVFEKILAERLGIDLPFPSLNSLIERDL